MGRPHAGDDDHHRGSRQEPVENVGVAGFVWQEEVSVLGIVNPPPLQGGVRGGSELPGYSTPLLASPLGGEGYRI